MVYRPSWIQFGRFLQFYEPTARNYKIKGDEFHLGARYNRIILEIVSCATALGIFLVQLFQLTSVFYGLI